MKEFAKNFELGLMQAYERYVNRMPPDHIIVNPDQNIGDFIKVHFIVATRSSLEDFYANTATGKSLVLYQSPGLEVYIFPENKLGVSRIYNSAIEQYANEQCILVFAHDDIHITDFFWMHSIFNGLHHFGVVGCAGNISKVPFQPSWSLRI